MNIKKFIKKYGNKIKRNISVGCAMAKSPGKVTTPVTNSIVSGEVTKDASQSAVTSPSPPFEVQGGVNKVAAGASIANVNWQLNANVGVVTIRGTYKSTWITPTLSTGSFLAIGAGEGANVSTLIVSGSQISPSITTSTTTAYGDLKILKGTNPTSQVLRVTVRLTNTATLLVAAMSCTIDKYP